MKYAVDNFILAKYAAIFLIYIANESLSRSQNIFIHTYSRENCFFYSPIPFSIIISTVTQERACEQEKFRFSHCSENDDLDVRISRIRSLRCFDECYVVCGKCMRLAHFFALIYLPTKCEIATLS